MRKLPPPSSLIDKYVERIMNLECGLQEYHSKNQLTLSKVGWFFVFFAKYLTISACASVLTVALYVGESWSREDQSRIGPRVLR